MLQNFLAKANEIAGMESTIMSSKKKNKTEKSEKSLLLEKIEMLKKKLESDIIFSFMTVNFIQRATFIIFI